MERRAGGAAPRLARFRALAGIYLGPLAVMLLRAAKPYYLAPAYPVLFAAGAVLAEALVRGRSRIDSTRELSPGARDLGGSPAPPEPGAAGEGPGRSRGRSAPGSRALARDDRSRGRRWLQPASFALLLAGGAIGAPFTLPVLPIPAYIRYAAALGIKPSAGERHRLGVLPQHYADMQGWPELAAEVARVYSSIPAGERERCAIFGQNYGEAGAIDLLGDAHGLPDALSGHNNYFLWGPRGYTGECVIVLNDDRETLERIFGDVRLAGTFRCPLCMPYEDGLRIHVCRRPKVSLPALWPRIKRFG